MKFNIANPNEKITEVALINLLEYYNYQLPQVYVDFLKFSNGCSSVNSDWIYGSEDIAERNKYYKIDKYIPNYIAIGDGDGTELYLMVKSACSQEVFVVDSISIAMECWSPTMTFEHFYQLIEYIDKCRFDDDSDCYNLYLIEPINDINMIMKIKNIFNYSGSLHSLLDGCRHAPFIIRENITLGLCQTLIDKNPEISKNMKIVKASSK